MPVTVQWDQDAPTTNLPNAGTDTKTYPATTSSGRVMITSETTSRSEDLPFEVPLRQTVVNADKDTVNAGGSAQQRTIVVTGAGWPPSTVGKVELQTGAAGAYGDAIAIVNTTTGSTGQFSADLLVPMGAAEGTYHIGVFIGSYGDLSLPVTVTAAEQLATPTNLTSPGQTTTSVDLAWDAVTNADQYVVQYRQQGETDWIEQAAVVTTSTTVSGLTEGITYEFQVKAQATGFVDSDWSATLTQATTTTPQLAAPQNLTATGQTTDSVDLSWDAVADATNYVVAWRTSPDGTWTEETPQAGTTATISGLNPDTAYDFRVKATADGFTESDWSTVITHSTDALPQLATPQNAAAGTPTTTTIPFSWDAVTDAEQYVVRFKASTDTDWTERTAVTVTNDTVDGLTSNTQYDLQVKAQATGFTDSAWTTTVQATTAA